MGTTFYRPELDILRLLAFVAVFVHHWLPQDPHGWAQLGLGGEVSRWCAAAVYSGAFGVDLFFALSAYLITTLLVRETDRWGQIDIPAFWLRRVLRIWPLYFCFLTAAISIVDPLLGSPAWSTLHKLGFFFFAANWTSATGGYPPSVAAPLWSVSIEEQFYLLWPLALQGRSRNGILKLAAVLLVCASITRVLLVVGGAAHPAIWCNTLARLDPIALGAALAVSDIPWHRRSDIVRGSMIAGGVLLAICLGRYGALVGGRCLPTYPLAAFACVLVLAGFVGREVGSGIIFRAMTGLGRISYGLYVFHALGLSLGRLLAGRVLTEGLIGALISVVLATLSYHILERPFLMIKTGFERINRPTA